MNKLFLVVGVIFLIGIIVGYVRGFLKIALSLAITIASIFLVMAITPHISGWMQESTAIGEKVKSKLTEMIEVPEGVSAEEIATIELPREQQISLIEGAGLPSVVRDMLLENNNNDNSNLLYIFQFYFYQNKVYLLLNLDSLLFQTYLLIPYHSITFCHRQNVSFITNCELRITN